MTEEAIDTQEMIIDQDAGGIFVNGQLFEKLPDDLYIPPEALKIFLEAFEGPLDLLLYLIRKHNFDVLNLPVADITRQYMQYIELMQVLNLELAAEYLLMAAMLAEIKSRMLLPRPIEETDEEDPRAELVRRLQEYQRYKTASENLEVLPRRGRDTFVATAEAPPMSVEKPLPEGDLKELMMAFADVLERAKLNTSHRVERETLSIRERMSIIVNALGGSKFVPFSIFFNVSEGRMGVVVTFIAILELIRGSVIEIVQSHPFAPIHLRAVVHE